MERMHAAHIGAGHAEHVATERQLLAGFGQVADRGGDQAADGVVFVFIEVGAEALVEVLDRGQRVDHELPVGLCRDQGIRVFGVIVLVVDLADDLLQHVLDGDQSGHSRFPVHGEDRDEILGILLAKDLLRGVVTDNGPSTVRELLRPAVLVPESKRLDILLREFRQSRNHMAIVIDEYGGVAGLVTIEDVLEQIVGQIDDEHDDAEDPNALIAAQADGQYLVDALTPISDFNARFGADFDDDEYDTIGGLITAAIGHLPEAGEELTLGRFGFRVARADARRLHTLHVSVHAA